MGTATAYRLAQLKNNNLTGILYMDVKFVTPFTNTGAINPAICLDFGTPYDLICPEGVWQIDPSSNPTGGNYNIYLWFDGGGANAFVGLIDNSFGPVKRASASTLASAWSAAPGTLNASGGAGRLVAGGYALRNNVTSFSQHAIARTSNPLPVTLTSLTANCIESDVLIEWKVSSETNAHYYLVQKSADGFNFSQIALVNASGNSNSEIIYSISDEVDEKNYIYRLLQFDYDGTENILGSVASNCFVTEDNLFNAWFNNHSHNIDVQFSVVTPGVYQLQLFDMTGSLVASKEFTIERAGVVMKSIDVSIFESGIYNLILQSKNSFNSSKIGIQN
jgi:hypothetical protein